MDFLFSAADILPKVFFCLNAFIVSCQKHPLSSFSKSKLDQYKRIFTSQIQIWLINFCKETLRMKYLLLIPPKYSPTILLPIYCLHVFVISVVSSISCWILFSDGRSWANVRACIHPIEEEKRRKMCLSWKFANMRSPTALKDSTALAKKIYLRNIGQQNDKSVGRMWMWIYPVAFSCVDAASRQENVGSIWLGNHSDWNIYSWSYGIFLCGRCE